MEFACLVPSFEWDLIGLDGGVLSWMGSWRIFDWARVWLKRSDPPLPLWGLGTRVKSYLLTVYYYYSNAL